MKNLRTETGLNYRIGALREAVGGRLSEANAQRLIAAEAKSAHAALVPIETLINLKQAQNKNLSYEDAWKQVEREQPDLIKAFNKAAGLPVDGTTEELIAHNEALIAQKIRDTMQKNPKLLFPQAEAMVEKEFPDLFKTKYKLGMRTGLAPHVHPVALAEIDLRLAAINAEIGTMRSGNPALSYGAAWRLVASERPALIAAYNEAASRR